MACIGEMKMNKKYIDIKFYNGKMAIRTNKQSLLAAYDWALLLLTTTAWAFAIAATSNMLQYFNIL